MLVLKRHYEFWFSIIALHKIGAVALPATAQLTTKDLEYRFNVAGVKAIICTAEGEISDYVDEAQKNCPTLGLKVIARGEKDGWISFTKGVEEADEEFPRPTGKEANLTTDPMVMFSSGTTGMPKLAWHNHSYALAHCLQLSTGIMLTDGLHYCCRNRLKGIGVTVWPVDNETAVFVYDFDKFEPGDLLSKIAKYKVTTFCAPPTIYRF